MTTYASSEMYPSFSPDGRQIAFTWDGEKGDNLDIYVKWAGETNALRLTSDPAADLFPVWAPDGKRITFQRRGPHSGIYTVSALGEAEQKLSDFAANYQMSWSPDGKWLGVSSNDQTSAIFLLPAEGGEPRRVSNPKAPGFDRAASFSPDGRQLAYASCTRLNRCDVYVEDLSPAYIPLGSARRITNQDISISGLTWSRDGKSVIYTVSRQDGMRNDLTGGRLPYLWRAEIDRRRPPQRLEIAGPHASFPSVSPVANRLVFQRNLRDVHIWRYRVGGDAEPLIVSSLSEGNPQFSPGGSRIAFSSDRSGEANEIWVAQADGSKPVQMTNNLGRNQGTPRWSPDGRWIAFDSQGQDSRWDIYVVDASGGRPRRISPDPPGNDLPSWSRDGKWIYFRSDRTGREEIWRIPFAGGVAEQVTKEGGQVAYESADGTTLFYTKASSSLFARPLSGGAERQLLAWVEARAFVPVDDGIYYIGRRSDRGQYPLQFFQFSSQTSRVLTNIDGVIYTGLSVSPDRTTILFTKTPKFGADLMMIENFQ
jgi:Tol biopolymer transport system component